MKRVFIKLIINIISLFLNRKKFKNKLKNTLWFRKNAYGENLIKNKYYGHVYLPFYNKSNPINNNIPEIYNKNGDKMDIYFIRDRHFAHEVVASSYFLFDRFNIGLNTHFYSHQSMLETMGSPIRRYGLLCESKGIVPYDYKLFEINKGLEKDFDLIFTYDEDILNKVSNARFCPFCSSPWYGTSRGGGEIDQFLYQKKKKNVSIISSNKIMCDLHLLRLDIARKCQKEGLADAYGTFNGGSFVKVAETLMDYRYSIVVENDVSPLFFTEKITNCFLSQTIPIYLGATDIGKFFNTDGIIKFYPGDDINKILSQCNEKDYLSRKEAILDNFDRVKNFLNPWDYIYQEYLSNI